MDMNTLFEQMGGTYSRQGDYMLPDVKLPKQEPTDIGIWGQRRRQYLKERHRVRYYNLLTKCELYPHLAEVNAQAVRMEETLTAQLARQEGLTEDLKAKDMMTWVRGMNNIQNRVREIIMAELICV